jgi:hypothetical protein
MWYYFVMECEMTDYAKNAGLVMAPLYYNFAKFIKARAEAPIKASYRSAYPIKHALDFQNVPNEKLFINRSAAWNMSEGNRISDYCRQQNLASPYTFVDHGYRGTVPNFLRQKGFPAEQVIFMAKIKGATEDTLSFIPPEDKSLFFIGQGGCLMDCLLEYAPHEYLEFGHFNNFKTEGGQVTPAPEAAESERPLVDNYKAGLTYGYQFSDANPQKFKKYLATLNFAKHHMHKLSSSTLRPDPALKSVARMVESIYS